MKFLKYLLILLVILGIGGFIAIKVMSEKTPQGQSGAAADELATAVPVSYTHLTLPTTPYV